MDISLILVSLLVFLAIVGPIFFLARSGNSDRKKLIKHFKNFANSHHLNIVNFEVWGDKIIGVDPNASKLLYIRKEANTFKTNFFSLSDIEECEPVVKHQNSGKSNNIQELEEAFLYIKLRDTNASEVKLFFYDKDTMVMPNYEESRLQKWHKIICSAV